MKKIFLITSAVFAYCILHTVCCFSQGTAINTTGAASDNSALLDVSSTTKGQLIPRMTTTQRNNIISPADALLIYNTSTQCFEAYNSVISQWVSFGCIGCILPGSFSASSASSITQTSFSANWTVSSGASSYYLDVATDNGFTGILTNYNNLNAGSVTTLSVTGLACGITYYYRVRAANFCGTSANSNTVSTTTASCCGGSGTINTIAGTGSYGYNGDGIPATSAELSEYSSGIAVDTAGNVYIADYYNQRIRKITKSTGLISTVAGNGTGGYNGDGIAATSANLNNPTGVAFDGSGNLYIADKDNNRIRKVTVATGIISTVAGTGAGGYNGDGIAATSASLYAPYGIVFDGADNMFIADLDNNRIRKVTASTGLISTIAGTGVRSYNGDGIPATSAHIAWAPAIALDNTGNVYFTDSDNDRVRKVTVATGLISTYAGTGTGGYSGDGGAATSANIDGPSGIAIDTSGNVYFSDRGNQRVRMVSQSGGIINTVIGTGTAGFSGDGGPATNAQINNAFGVAVDVNGDIYITDASNYRTRKICH